jgi:hypothetical protein
MVSRQRQAVVNQTHYVQPARPSRSAPAQRSQSNPKMGNQTVQRLLRDGVIQAKLTVNQPGDCSEQEADRVADQGLAAPANPAVSGAPPRIQLFSGQPNRQVDAVPASVDHVLCNPGRPLDPALQQDMEQRFGHDFSRVRVHSGATAEQSAREVNANAYTVGHNVVFASGQFAPRSSEGRRLIAHELTHVVQQSSAAGNVVGRSNEGLSPISAMTDPAEVEADHVATRVASGQPAGPIHAATSNALHAQPAHGLSKKVDWEPEVEADTRSAHVKVGKTVSLKFHVSNERTAPKGTTFDWRGMRLEQSAAIAMVGFSDHVGAHATLVVKGQTAGISDVGTTVYFRTPGAQEDYEYTPLVRVEVGSEIEVAEAELAQIEDLRAAGKEASPSRESAAQQEAKAAAQHSLGKASHAAGGEIDQIVTSVGLDIAKIENARYRGYQDALGDLNLTQLDEKEQSGNVKSFALSLVGNLVWALSGLIALTPFGLEGAIAAGLINKLGMNVRDAHIRASSLAKLAFMHRGRVATAVGVGGAMLAQFANGLPSGGSSGGGNVSRPLIQFRDQLNALNAGVFNAMKRDLYSTLIRLLVIAPPAQDVDAQQYAGRLENGIRQVLFGGYYENGGATGNQVNPAVIQTDARNQLLRRLVVSSGTIVGEKLVSTNLDKYGVGKLVGPAVSLVGGAKALELGDYELVVEQLQRAARVLSLEGLPNVDADQLRDDFARAGTVTLSARWAPSGKAKLFSGGSGSAWATLTGNWVVEASYNEADEAMGVEQQMVEQLNGDIFDVDFIKIRKQWLADANIGKGGATAFSLNKLKIHLVDRRSGGSDLWLIYNP